MAPCTAWPGDADMDRQADQTTRRLTVGPSLQLAIRCPRAFIVGPHRQALYE